MPIQSPQELLLHELHGIEDAEAEASRALESQMEEVENAQLQKLLQRRLQQGERLLRDVQKNLEKLNGESGGRQNEAARGLIRDAEQLLQEVQSPEMKEAVLIAGVQKLEHYCIAVWGTVRAMAEQMGDRDLARAMQRALDEGYKLDEELTRLAKSRVNPSAMEAGEEEDKEEDEFEAEDEEEDEDAEDEDEDEDEDEEDAEEEDEDEEDEDEDKGAGSEQEEVRRTAGSKQPQKPGGSQKSGGAQQSGGAQKSGGSQKERGGAGQGKSQGASSDLKSREYRDDKGEVHHHTREYMGRRGKS